MTTPAYIANPHQPPHHRGGNTNASKPASDSASLERAEILLELKGALVGAASIAKLLGTTGVRDYEMALDVILDNIRKDRRDILEGSK